MVFIIFLYKQEARRMTQAFVCIDAYNKDAFFVPATIE